MVDINELLRDMQGRVDLTIGGVTLPNGVQLQNVYMKRRMTSVSFVS